MFMQANAQCRVLSMKEGEPHMEADLILLFPGSHRASEREADVFFTWGPLLTWDHGTPRTSGRWATEGSSHEEKTLTKMPVRAAGAMDRTMKHS